MSLIVTFAVKQEFTPWRRIRRFETTEVAGVRCYRTSTRGQAVFVALSGVGARRLEAISALAQPSKIQAAIVAGLAGGLNPRWQSGDVLAAEAVCDVSGARWVKSDTSLARIAAQCGAQSVERFVTLDRIARTAKKNLAWLALPMRRRWNLCTS